MSFFYLLIIARRLLNEYGGHFNCPLISARFYDFKEFNPYFVRHTSVQR